MAQRTYSYLTRHREFTKDYYFYLISISASIFDKQYANAFAWADSLGTRFPNDKLTYFARAQIYRTLIYYDTKDSTITKKYKKLLVENFQKVKEPGRTSENENSIDNSVDIALTGFYFNEKDYRAVIDIVEKSKLPFDPVQNNFLAYAYIYQKKYKKAEDVLKKVVLHASDRGDYWDSLAELYSIQHKDSLAVVNLRIALKCPQRSEAVSVQAYQKDTRWDRLREREDFRSLMKRSSF